MPENPSALRRITTVLVVLAGCVVVLSYPAAAAVDRVAGREVVLLPVAPFDEAQVRDNRDQFDDAIEDPAERRKAIVEIYGSTPSVATSRVLFVDDAELIRPQEDPELLLLPPAKDGARRIQAKSAWFAAKMATIGAAVAFAALLVARRFVK